MRILHVTPSFVPAWRYGGPVESVYKLCLHLQHLGHQVQVLTTNADGPQQVLPTESGQDMEIEAGIKVRYCSRIGRESFSPQLFALLPQYVRLAEVVHVTSVYSSPTPFALFLCRIFRKPLVWSPRGALQEWEGSTNLFLKKLWLGLIRLVAPRKMLLHVTSQQEALESQAKFPDARIVTIPNGIEIETGERLEKKPGPLNLLFLGRLHPKKGIENLLQACRMIELESHFDWRLKIAGSGAPEYTQHLQQEVNTLGLSPKVEFLGHLDQQQKRQLFQDADILVAPSYTENFAIVVAEALAHAVPVIASYGTPWRELEEQGCGLWVSNDPESLARAIKKMKGMPLRNMGLKGRDWMEQAFNWPSIARKMAHVYREQVQNAR